MLLFIFAFVCCLFIFAFLIWFLKGRGYQSPQSVASAYDSWTEDRLLERLWGEHIHLGFYKEGSEKQDFREAKVHFVHQLVIWSGLDKLPKGSRVLDIGCGIGGSSRILAQDYGFDVLGITISPAQVRRANELTEKGVSCRFQVMNALDLQLPESSFDGVWSVEAGPHMPDKQLYADEMLRVLRPGGVLAVADWNRQEDHSTKAMNLLDGLIMQQLLNQWAHPEFATINGFKKNLIQSTFSGGFVEAEDWTGFTLPSWMDSIKEGFRRPKSVLGLGVTGLAKSLREVPTILMMRWAFAKGLMQFGVFKARG